MENLFYGTALLNFSPFLFKWKLDKCYSTDPWPTLSSLPAFPQPFNSSAHPIDAIDHHFRHYRKPDGQEEGPGPAGLLQPPAEGVTDVHERRRIAHLPRGRIPDPHLRGHDVHPQPQRCRRVLLRLEHQAG